MSIRQLAQAASLIGTTLPDGTKDTSEAEPASGPAEAETGNAEGQIDQTSDPDAGEVNSV